jgi:hypothetical protein
MTAASIQIGSPRGSPNGVTPPISMPVTARASSGAAKDAFLVPRSDRTVRLTASRSGASTTHAAYRRGSALPATRIVLAESAGSKP